MLTLRNLFPPGSRPKNEKIEQCSAMLPNRMRCPKGGTWEVVDDSNNSTKQYCTYHTKLLEAEAVRQGVEVKQASIPQPIWPEGVVLVPQPIPQTEQTQTELNQIEQGTQNVNKPAKPPISPK